MNRLRIEDHFMIDWNGESFKFSLPCKDFEAKIVKAYGETILPTKDGTEPTPDFIETEEQFEERMVRNDLIRKFAKLEGKND